MEYDKGIVALRESVNGIGFIDGIDVHAKFMEIIFEKMDNNSNVLDVGTGNGFILSELLSSGVKKAILYGVDSSDDMVEEAKKRLANNANIIHGDANNLPFSDSFFDMVTAKNVTRINTKEVYRVLKPGGNFIFREYGKGKGMVEVANLFSGRIIRQRNIEYYIDSMKNAGFKNINAMDYIVHHHYDSPGDLIKVVKSFPFIENFSKNDEQIIFNVFSSCDIVITSDPFIITAEKEEKI